MSDSVRPDMTAIDPIVIVRETAAAPAAAWSALVDPAHVRQWFTDASPVGRVGDAYRLDFGDSIVEGIVSEIVPGHRFAYTWSWAHDDPRHQTHVSWEVQPLPGGGSRLTLRHDGWTEVAANEATRDDHAGYWEGYLDDLVNHLETEPDASG